MTSSSRSGRLISHKGKSLLIEDLETGAVTACTGRRRLGRAVCGDLVDWEQNLAQPGSGIVTRLQPRRSELIRPDFRGNPRCVAANLDRLFIVMAPEPAPDESLLRRAATVALIQGMEPWLVLNKSDIDNGKPLRDLATRYAPLGLPTLWTSASAQTGLESLLQATAGHESMLAGQSGVGKSSLTAALLPEQALKVGALSDATGFGRHTTSTAIRYALPRGGGLIDAPGVRDFALWPMPQRDFIRGFPEFGDLPKQCRFNDCRHTNEPGCAVLDALDNGEIPELRYETYVDLIDMACPR